MEKKQNFLMELIFDLFELFAYYICKYYNYFKFKIEKWKTRKKKKIKLLH